MQRFHVKSILLGIGIGIIITSIISMIYLAGVNPESNISKETVMEMAKKYGMVESTEFVKIDDTKDAQKVDSKNNAGTKNNAQATDESAENAAPEQVKPAEAETKTVSIEAGDTSEAVASKLLKAGLINDKSAFIKELSNMGLSDEINIGEFKIKTGTDLNGIVKILTRTK